ncbi:hypothetical protein AB0L10_40785 [Streptomyces flaveolus]|uniref:hypothetical protein n=1 Tax=Streptomyces flaveolus TaxID=67297 RepID=UPI003412C781
MGEVPQGGVGPVDHDHQPRHTVEAAAEGDAALRLEAEADQGVMDASDVAAVRDRRQVLRPQVGDAGVVEDQGVGALVEELGGEGAQEGRAAAAGAAADQDVRGDVDIDGDGPAVGADADECGGSGQCLKLLAQAEVGEAQPLRERGRVRHRGGVPLLCCVW